MTTTATPTKDGRVEIHIGIIRHRLAPERARRLIDEVELALMWLKRQVLDGQERTEYPGLERDDGH